MLLGVAFFSFIMSAFIEIISNYDRKMGDDAANREAALHNWLTLVTRFHGSDGGSGKPLPKYLAETVEKHLSYHWEHNRLKWLEPSFLRIDEGRPDPRQD